MAIKNQKSKVKNRPGDAARFAQSFAALGEPTRLRIMQILPREPICEQMYNVIELAEELGLTQPTVSHHLKILSEAGLVLCRRQCNSLYFYVNQEAVLRWLQDVKCRFGCAHAQRPAPAKAAPPRLRPRP